MTIEVLANQNQTNLMCNQLAKMVPVHSVKLLNPNHSIRRELILYKVRAKNSDDKNEIIQIANIFRGSIIDVSKETLTLSVIGDEKKTDAVPGTAGGVRHRGTGAHRHDRPGTWKIHH